MPAKRNALEALNTNNTNVAPRQSKKAKIGAKDTPPAREDKVAQKQSPTATARLEAQSVTFGSVLDHPPSLSTMAGSSAMQAGKKRKTKTPIPAASLPGLPDFEPFTVPFEPHQAKV